MASTRLALAGGYALPKHSPRGLLSFVDTMERVELTRRPAQRTQVTHNFILGE